MALQRTHSHLGALQSVIGAISHVYGCWKYKAMFKSGMFVIIYLVVMGSTRLPGTRKGPSVQVTPLAATAQKAHSA